MDYKADAEKFKGVRTEYAEGRMYPFGLRGSAGPAEPLHSTAKNRVAIRTVSYSPVVHVSRISETSANSIWRSNRRL